MKRILIILTLLFPLAIFAAEVENEDDAAPQTNTHVTDQTKTLYVSEKSPTLTLKLESTPSTGFIWILKKSDRNLLKLVKHTYIPSEKNMPGAPGTDIWIFNANLENFGKWQRTELVFIHAQPWNQSEQISVKKFRVVRK